MNRNSHIYIADYVLQKYFPQATPGQKRAFMLGCVHPDKNPFTYLKGSVRHKLLRGHNWECSQRLIQRLCTRLKFSQEFTWKQAYEIGLLLHYCCDAFTFAHNQAFSQNLKEHRRYEAHLHRKLTAGPPDNMDKEICDCDLWERICQLHSRYSKEPCGAVTDRRYIFLGVTVVCAAYFSNLTAGETPASYKIPKNTGEICPVCTCKIERRVLY